MNILTLQANNCFVMKQNDTLIKCLSTDYLLLKVLTILTRLAAAVGL